MGLGVYGLRVWGRARGRRGGEGRKGWVWGFTVLGI